MNLSYKQCYYILRSHPSGVALSFTLKKVSDHLQYTVTSGVFFPVSDKIRNHTQEMTDL